MMSVLCRRSATRKSHELLGFRCLCCNLQGAECDVLSGDFLHFPADPFIAKEERNKEFIYNMTRLLFGRFEHLAVLARWSIVLSGVKALFVACGPSRRRCMAVLRPTLPKNPLCRNAAAQSTTRRQGLTEAN